MSGSFFSLTLSKRIAWTWEMLFAARHAGRVLHDTLMPYLTKLKYMEETKIVGGKQIEVKDSKSFKVVKKIADLMDNWYIDPILGVIPNVGDLVTPVFSLPFLYLSIFKVKSVALTLAMIYNILIDCALGMLPFWIGNILDFFNKSYKENYRLIVGYVEKDRNVIRAVNRKVTYLISMIVLLIAVIIGLIILIGKLIVWLGDTIYSWFV